MTSSPRTASVLSGVAVIALTMGCTSATSATVSASASGFPATPSASGAMSDETVYQPTARGALSGHTIVIDPGHTGAWNSTWGYHKVPDGNGHRKACNSSGTATNAGYSEHAFNFAEAKALAAALQARGAKVVLTRTNDTSRSTALCVNHRADLLNSTKADLMISIHADGNLGKGHRGFHLITSTVMHGGKTAISRSRALAADLRSALQTTGMPRSNYIGKGTAYSRRSDLGTLNFAQRPAVMIELGNMRNSADAKLLTSSTFRSRAAAAIANAITTYLN